MLYCKCCNAVCATEDSFPRCAFMSLWVSETYSPSKYKARAYAAVFMGTEMTWGFLFLASADHNGKRIEKTSSEDFRIRESR